MVSFSAWFLALKPADQGPIYTETVMGRFPVEPWNTYSDLIFFVILIYWIWITRLDFKRFPIIVVSLPILLLGLVGGLIYHATRSHDVWRILDAGPIAVLALLVSVYLWTDVLGSVFRAMVVLIVPALLFKGIDVVMDESQTVMIFIGYAFLAAVIIVPAVLHCRKNHWRNLGWLVAAALIFGLALTMRTLDEKSASYLPMGTHFLWHIFGGVASFCGMKYVYETEKKTVEPRMNPD